MSKKQWLHVLLLAGWMALPASGFEITKAEGASLRAGRVSDDQGVPLHAATVMFRHLETAVTTSVLTDAEGEFWVPLLASGEYEISALKKGFEASAPRKVMASGPWKDLVFTLPNLQVIPISQLSTSDLVPHLPEAPEKMLLVRTCGNCHSLGTVLGGGGRRRSEWEEVLKRMQGMQSGYIRVPPTTMPSILEYLSRYFGPDSVRTEEMGRDIKRNRREEIPLGHEVVFTEYDIPTAHGRPHTAVPDKRGNVWFTEFAARKIGKLDILKGEITEYPLQVENTNPHGITVGPDGTVWFTALPTGIGRIDPATGQMVEYPLPGVGAIIRDIWPDDQGRMWFVPWGRDKVTSAELVKRSAN